MRVVLDVNVLLSGLITGTTTPSRIIQSWEEDLFDIWASEHILDGVARALMKPYWRRRLDHDQLQSRLAQLKADVRLVDPAEGIHGVADDDEDDLILATAVAARADYLVTGDKGLLGLGEFRGTPIVTPRTFLDELAGVDNWSNAT
jgi:hypothetical protein